MHKATSCHPVLPPQLPKSLSKSKECKLPGGLHQKVMQSSSSHASGMAKCRHGGGESRIYLNGRMCDFTGIHSTHRSKILLSSPTKIHWTLSLSFPHQKLLHVLLPQYRSPSLQGYADRRLLSPQTQSHFKKIQRTAFGSKEAFEMWKNLECRTQVDGEVISP